MARFRWRNGDLGETDTTSSESDPAPPPAALPPLAAPIVSPDRRFYWDGDKWVPLAEPAFPDPGGSPRSVGLPALSWNVANVAALVGAGFIAVGCFLPWANFGFVNVSGIQASGGWLFLVGAAIIAVAASISLREFVGIGIGISFVVFGLAVGVGVASEGSHLDSIVSNANQGAGFAVATAGVGLGVVAIGTAIVVFAGVYDLIRTWSER